jgi:DNA mismatch repair ATPase MutS
MKTEITNLIKPFSGIGRVSQQNFIEFKSGDEGKVSLYYENVASILFTIKKYPEAITLFGGILAHFEDISGLLSVPASYVYQISDLYEIKHFIYQYRNLCNLIKKEKYSDLFEFFPVHDFSELFSLLDKDNQDSPSFFISTKYSQRLNDLKVEVAKYKTEIENAMTALQEVIRAELKIKNFGQTIAISRMESEVVAKLRNSKYFYVEDENFANITFRVQKPERVLYAESQIQKLDTEIDIESTNICRILTEKIRENQDELKLALSEVGEFDLLFAKAIFGRNYGCCIPEKIICDAKNDNLSNPGIVFSGSGIWDISMVSELKKINIKYQKISLEINQPVNVLTGSNMGGKTSILNLIARISMMVKFGIPVPAEQLSIKLFDNIYLQTVGPDEETTNLSSFGSEVISLQNVIEATGFNLFCLDEFGRGTNPAEGQALFYAVLQHFSKQTETILLATTHYSIPTDIPNCTYFQMIGLDDNYYKDLSDNRILSFNEKLQLIHKYMNYQPVKVIDSHQVPCSAINIAELLGLDADIVKVSTDFLKR